MVLSYGRSGGASKTDDGSGDEPLLKEDTNRFVLFPIKYDDVSTRDVLYQC